MTAKRNDCVKEHVQDLKREEVSHLCCLWFIFVFLCKKTYGKRYFAFLIKIGFQRNYKYIL